MQHKRRFGSLMQSTVHIEWREHAVEARRRGDQHSLVILDKNQKEMKIECVDKMKLLELF